MYSVAALPSKTCTTPDTLHFRMCNILKLTQNGLVLIPYSLNYSQQFFVSITDEKINAVELLKRAIITEWQKVSQRFIDSSFNEWCHGLECVVKNDCGHVEHCNLA